MTINRIIIKNAIDRTRKVELFILNYLISAIQVLKYVQVSFKIHLL
jgi:hypothetical protein